MSTSIPDNYRGTLQCTNCANVSRVVLKNGIAVDVKPRIFDLDIPEGLPTDLEKILSEAILCFEVGSNAGAVVLSGLFLEGLLKNAGISEDIKDGLFKMIQKAHNDGIISEFNFHVATASRILRNIGAHYSKDLINLSPSDLRLVLKMVRKLADDIINAGAIKTQQIKESSMENEDASAQPKTPISERLLIVETELRSFKNVLNVVGSLVALVFGLLGIALAWNVTSERVDLREFRKDIKDDVRISLGQATGEPRNK